MGISQEKLHAFLNGVNTKAHIEAIEKLSPEERRTYFCDVTKKKPDAFRRESLPNNQ